MAQDDYYYEIQLTNKQLVFYFLAGATVLILCFLAGIMVGRGVDVRNADTRVAREEPVVPIGTEGRGSRTTPVPADGYSYPQRLTAEKPPEVIESRPAARGPTPAATVAPRPTATPVVARPTPKPTAKATPTPTPKATPLPKATPTPKAAATPKPKPTATPHAAATAAAAAAEGPLNLQVGAFKDKASADSVVARLRRKGYAAHATSPDGARDGLYVVRVGPYKTRAEADRARARLEQERFKPFIVRQ